MELMQILENKKPNQIYGLLGNINISTNNANYTIVSEYKFPDTVKVYLNSKKDEKALQMVGLDASYLTKTSADLSLGELKKIILAHALLINKPYIILEYFEKDFTNQEKQDFKRLFRLLAQNYQKTIVIFTNDLSFVWDIADLIFYVSDNKVQEFSKNDYSILENVDIPPIIDFINITQNHGINIPIYKNTSDLLKEIYRKKEQK